ncbi:hypothetical protein NA78x_000411 [Anatilimnocola sp. NA78]|uniref:hypothetical protein n=1 Tax=Anatilimnocola sp. NA78 TaxID=3415683 RepID=UPI003CE56E20
MFTAEDTFRMIVGLADVRDGDLFDVVANQDSTNIPPRHLAAFRGLGQELQRLIDDYRFVESPLFLDSIQSKSAPVAEMLRKTADAPVRRKEHRQRFVEALSALPENRTAFALIAERHHDILVRALAALEVARNNA